MMTDNNGTMRQVYDHGRANNLMIMGPEMRDTHNIPKLLSENREYHDQASFVSLLVPYFWTKPYFICIYMGNTPHR